MTGFLLPFFMNKNKGGLGVVSGGEATERIRSEESNAPQGGPRWVWVLGVYAPGSKDDSPIEFRDERES